MNEQQQPGQNKTCFDAGELIAWRDGALSQSETEKVTAHLAGCARCTAEERALMRDSRQLFDLLSTLDPLLASRTETEAALARFQQRFSIHNVGSVQQYDGDLDQEEFPLTESEWYHPPVIPKRSSTRLRRLGALVQTLAAVLVVAALIGSSLLLLRARVPATGDHSVSRTQTYSTAPTQTIPTTRVTANSYDGFVATNGTMFGFDAQHTNANPYERILNPTTVGGLTKQWVYQTGTIIYSSPAVAGGVVYIASGDGDVYALDATSGTKKWAYSMAGGQVDSSPAVAGGVVYIASFDGNVYALDAASGTKKWAYRTGDFMDSSPAVAGGVVYIGSDNGNVYALDAASGTKKWAYQTGKSIDSSPAVAGGVVYISSQNGNVYALDATSGTKKWAYPIGGRQVLSSPAVAGGVVYIGSNGGNVYALDAASGTKKWAYRTRDSVSVHVLGPIDSSPAVAGGVVYIGSGDGNVYALDAASGTKKWAYQTGEFVESSPVVAGGVVYIGSQNGNVYALDAASGTKRWAYQTHGSIFFSSTTVANGRVYVGSLDGNLYAFHLPGT